MFVPPSAAQYKCASSLWHSIIATRAAAHGQSGSFLGCPLLADVAPCAAARQLPRTPAAAQLPATCASARARTLAQLSSCNDGSWLLPCQLCRLSILTFVHHPLRPCDKRQAHSAPITMPCHHRPPCTHPVWLTTYPVAPRIATTIAIRNGSAGTSAAPPLPLTYPCST